MCSILAAILRNLCSYEDQVSTLMIDMPWIVLEIFGEYAFAPYWSIYLIIYLTLFYDTMTPSPSRGTHMQITEAVIRSAQSPMWLINEDLVFSEM